MTKLKTNYPNLTKTVRVIIKSKYSQIDNKDEWHLNPGNLKTSFRSDIQISKDNDNLLCIEIEEAQPHPDTNVTKYWPFLEANPQTRVTLLQIFGRGFMETDNNYASRMQLCKFVANKLEAMYPNRFKYVWHKFAYPSEYYMHHSEEIAYLIVDIIRKELSR